MSRKKKNKKFVPEDDIIGLIEQDENFYFIAGYTDGGVPYGLTWEEYEAEQSFNSDTKLSLGGVLMKELKLTEHQFHEIVDSYDTYVDGIDFFLNIDTGEVVTLCTFDQDEEDEELSEIIEEGFNEIYFRIPHRESNKGYVDMVDFAETVADEHLRVRLLNVLNGGKKIFRKFKDTLSSDGHELERYYLFVSNRNRERVMDWLESMGVKPIVE
ncbi:MAG: UPF0158 family protein [Bacillota bacterium]